MLGMGLGVSVGHAQHDKTVSERFGYHTFSCSVYCPRVEYHASMDYTVRTTIKTTIIPFIFFIFSTLNKALTCQGGCWKFNLVNRLKLTSVDLQIFDF